MLLFLGLNYKPIASHQKKGHMNGAGLQSAASVIEKTAKERNSGLSKGLSWSNWIPQLPVPVPSDGTQLDGS